MFSVILIAIIGVVSTTFLLWCLCQLHLECSRPSSVKVTAFGATARQNVQLIEFPQTLTQHRLKSRRG